MHQFMNIGFDNMVAVERIVAIVSPESAPVKRLVQAAKEDGNVIDVTHGRKTRAVVFTDSIYHSVCDSVGYFDWKTGHRLGWQYRRQKWNNRKNGESSWCYPGLPVQEKGQYAPWCATI